MGQVSVFSSKHSSISKPLFFANFVGLHARYMLWKSAQIGFEAVWSYSKQYGMFIGPPAVQYLTVTETHIRSGIGSIICSVMMQQLNQKHPENYILAMRILWGPISLMILCWAFVPESPWFHARRGNKEKTMRAMRQLYGGVEGYNFEDEYWIIVRTIEHEKTVLQEKPRYFDVFKGLNLVFVSCMQSGKPRADKVLETYAYRNDPGRCPATCRPRHYQYLFDM